MIEPIYTEGYPPQHAADWYAAPMEDVVDPDLPIIDSHHHIFDVEGDLRYDLDDLGADLSSGHNVVGTLYVETSAGYLDSGPEELRSSGEAAWVADLIEGADPVGRRIRGMLGWADLLLGDALGTVLDVHSEAGRGCFKGIRDRVVWSKDPRFRCLVDPGHMLRTEYLRGSRQLAQRGLVHECWMYHEQIPAFTRVAGAVPDGQFVLDHLGGLLARGIYQDQRQEVLAEWRGSIEALAALPNTAVKIGGFGMSFFGSGFDLRRVPPSSDEIAAEWGGHVQFLIDVFGPDRSMFESNFPIDTASFTYRTIWNAFKKMSSPYSESERAALFHDTARRVYSLA